MFPCSLDGQDREVFKPFSLADSASPLYSPSMIVWITGYPRSGTSWFRIILHQALGIRSYSAHHEPKCVTGIPEVGHIDGLVPEDAWRSQTPVWVKTHSPTPADTSDPYIYLVRDGRDACISYAHYLAHIRGEGNRFGQNVLAEVIRGYAPFGSWSHHIETWWEARPRFSWINYEDMDSPVHVITAIERAVAMAWNTYGITLPVGTSGMTFRDVPSFEELHERSPRQFRCGKQGQWREVFDNSKYLEDLFWDRHGKTMDKVGYWRER